VLIPAFTTKAGQSLG